MADSNVLEYQIRAVGGSEAKVQMQQLNAAVDQSAASAKAAGSAWEGTNSILLTQNGILNDVKDALFKLAEGHDTAGSSAKKHAEAEEGLGASLLEIGAEAKEAAAQLAEFAEAAKLGGGASASLAGGIGAVGAIGGGVAISVLSEMLNRVKENAIEMEHLQAATGAVIPEMVGLTQAMAEAGVTNVNINQIITRLSRAMEEARDPASRQADAFKELGVATAGWGEKLPPFVDVLTQLAVHLHDSTNNVQDMANVSLIAGRNVVGLTGFLKGAGDELPNLIGRHKEYGDAVERAAPAALELQKVEAQLGETWNTLVSSILPGVVTGLKALTAVWLGLKLDIEEVATAITATFQTAVVKAVGVAKTLWAGAKGDLQGVYEAQEEAANKTADVWKAAAAEIQASWDNTDKALKGLYSKPIEAGPTGDTNTPFEKESMLAKLRKVQEDQIKQEESFQLSQVELERSGTELRTKLGRESLAQHLEDQESYNARELAIKQESIDRQIAVAKTAPDSAEQIAELNSKRASEQENYYKQDAANYSKYMEERAGIAKKVEEDLKKISSEVVSTIQKEGEEEIEYQGKVLEQRIKNYDSVLEMQMKQAEDAIKVDDIVQEEYLKNAQDRIKAEEEVDLKTAKSKGLGQQAQIALIAEYTKRLQQANEALTTLKINEAIEQHGVYSPEAAKASQEGGNKDTEIQQAQLKKLQDLVSETDAQFTRFFDKINSQFAAAITGMLTKGESFHKAFQKLTQEMLTDFVSSLATMLLKWIENHVIMQAVETAFQAAMKALHIATASTALAADTAANAAGAPLRIAKVEGAAGVGAAEAAAANAYDPIAAATAAAEMFAQISAWSGIAAFESGGQVRSGNHPSLAILHPNEKVFNASQSRGIDKMLESGGSSAGGHTFNYHAAAGDDEATTKANFKAFMKEANKSMRSKNMQPVF